VIQAKTFHNVSFGENVGLWPLVMKNMVDCGIQLSLRKTFLSYLYKLSRVEPYLGENIMPDDLTNKGPQDRSRISLLEPHEVQYWADKFNVSKERLSEAVRNVGHSVDAVEKELKKLA
jgi:hypothetical protein